MKINYKKSYLLLLLLIFSCTIQKRTFNKGFHINWNHNSYSSLVKTSTNQKSNLDTFSLSLTDSPENSKKNEIESVLLASTQKSNIDFDKRFTKNIKKQALKIEKYQSKLRIQKPIYKNYKNFKPTYKSEEEKKLENQSMTSLILGVLSLFIFISAIPALIFGAIALKKIRNQPKSKENNINRWMAIFGVLTAFISLILTFFIIALLLVWTESTFGLIYLSSIFLAIIILYFTLLNI